MTARSPPADRAAPPSFFGRPPPSECAACTPPCTSAAAASPPPARPPPLPPPRLARPWGHPVSPSSVISGVGTVSLILAQRASPSHDFHALLEKLVAELGVHSIMPEAKADVEAFCRLLAKVAYSFAVAELGGHPFESPLVSYASGGDLSHCLHYIGSSDTEEPPTETLHDLAILNGPPGAPLVVRIRLLSRLGTPTYYAVVRETTGRANPSLKPPDTGLPASGGLAHTLVGKRGPSTTRDYPMLSRPE